MEVINRRKDETWRECVARHGRSVNLETEVVEAFDYECSHGRHPSDAARFVLLTEFEIEVL